MPNRRSDDTQYTLLASGSATGNAVAIRGGEYMVFFDGTISGATVALQMQSPSGQWMTVEVFTGSAVSYTVLPRSQTGIDLPAGNVRCAVTGGTSPVVNAYLVGLG
jgi:hypothetical protein